MAFAAARIDAAVLLVPSATRAAVKTAFDDAHTALYAVMVTTAGKSATGPEWVQVEDELIEVCERIAKSMQDT